MLHSQKCQYALRAVLELAKDLDGGPTRVADIAAAQAIPPRFLENILNELKRGGYVDSVRGRAGGYLLTRDPCELTVGEVIRYVQGPIALVRCMFAENTEDCPLEDNCPYLPMWEQAEAALAEVYDSTTFADLLGRDCEEQAGKKGKRKRKK